MKLQRAGIIGEFLSIFVNELVNSCLLIVLCLLFLIFFFASHLVNGEYPIAVLFHIKELRWCKAE